MQLTIRPLQSQDKSDWAQLWHDYLEFYESTVDNAVYDTTFRRLLSAKRNNQNAFLALKGTRAVGLVHYLYHPHNWKVEDVCYL
ncbi:MAG: GNAT family N-acetyltransferase, partial [Paracoccaceae bacterium]|nr:GNAT family N-acetyltransferase [Paracoccaceae bacterium]